MNTPFRLIGWLSLTFVAGVTLAGSWGWQAVAAAALVMTLLSLYRQTSGDGRLQPLPAGLPQPLWLALALLLGFFRFQISQPQIDPFHIAWFADRDYPVWVTGFLTEPPDIRDGYTNLRIAAEWIDTGSGDLQVSGEILVRTDAPEATVLPYGQVIRVYGHLQTPPENPNFSYRDYLARQGIYAYIPDGSLTRLPFRRGARWLQLVYTFKEQAQAMIYRLYPDPEASLLAGILLGVETGLPSTLKDAFKITGTSHIIAISGFNIAIIAGIFFSLFGRLLGRTRGALTAALAIAIYTVLVGADAAVVRAALMGGLGLLARTLGRRQDGLNTLFFVAGVMTAFDPNMPWDIGFQLSFGATLGLILYGNPLQNRAESLLRRFIPANQAQRAAELLSEFVLLTFAAQLTTLPIIAWHFRQISLVSFLANPFILPAQPAVMILGGLAVLGGLFWLPLGKVLALVAWPFVVYTIRLVEWFAGFPHSVLVLGDITPLWVLLWYLALFSLPWWWPKRQRIAPGTVFVTVSLLAWLAWRSLFLLPDGLLHITLLDNRGADVLFITTPNGNHLLINGGSSVTSLSDALGRRLPPQQRRLDALIVASTANYQLEALPRILERYPPEQVFWGGSLTGGQAARTVYRQVQGAGLPLHRAAAGDQIEIDDGIFLTVLDVTNRGMTLLLTWNNFRMLLPIGAQETTFDQLERGRKVGAVEVLLLADSGHQRLNPADWLNTLNPQLVLLNIETPNTFGLPHPETLERLQGYSLLRTDQNGNITLHTDGKNLWINVEKP